MLSALSIARINKVCFPSANSLKDNGDEHSVHSASPHVYSYFLIPLVASVVSNCTIRFPSLRHFSGDVSLSGIILKSFGEVTSIQK